jgi:hypothetical protein
MAERLEWTLPSSVDAAQAEKFERYFNTGPRYVASLSSTEGRFQIDLRLRTKAPPVFQRVAINRPPGAIGRWSPLTAALADWDSLLQAATERDFSLSRMQPLSNIDPTADPLKLNDWIRRVSEAVATADPVALPEVVSWVEFEFTRRFGANQALAYVRSYEATSALQLVEVMAKTEVVDVAEFAALVNAGARPQLLAEQSHGAMTGNHFLVPTAIAYPDWIGTAVGSLPFEVVFALETARTNMPLLDARHIGIWHGAINAWWDLQSPEATKGHWVRLRPARNAEFIDWYVARLNALLAIFADLETTATTAGVARPMAQLAMLRTFLQLQDFVGRMLITSEHFGRVMAAMQVLARFDDLSWEFRRIVDPAWLEGAIAPLARDKQIGGVFEAYGRQLQRKVVGELLRATHAKSDGAGRLTLSTGRHTSESEYLGSYLKAVRDTIHGFDIEKLERTLGAHRGILPEDLPQFAAILWLMFMAEPTPLLAKFCAPGRS